MKQKMKQRQNETKKSARLQSHMAPTALPRQ